MPHLISVLVQLAPFVDPTVVALGWVVLLVFVVRRPRAAIKAPALG
jgi:hypothetical protein